MQELNKHILLVMKWLDNKDSVTQEELKENHLIADAYAANAAAYAADADAADAAYAAYADAHAANAEKWVGKYFERSGENKQDYLEALHGNLNALADAIESPVYTQAMCDAGEPPSVGMECLAVYGKSADKVTVVHINSKGQFACIDDDGDYLIHSLLEGIGNEFKPLTPPVELKSKGLYLFTVGKKVDMVGEAYFTAIDDEPMLTNIRTNTSYSQDCCIDIKALTVEGE